jgi:hypothetical protein
MNTVLMVDFNSHILRNTIRTYILLLAYKIAAHLRSGHLPYETEVLQKLSIFTKQRDAFGNEPWI